MIKYLLCVGCHNYNFFKNKSTINIIIRTSAPIMWCFAKMTNAIVI